MTTASNTSLIIAASPAFVALLNRLLGRELLAPRGWLGIALAFVGIVLIVEGGGGLEFGSAGLHRRPLDPRGHVSVGLLTPCWLPR